MVAVAAGEDSFFIPDPSTDITLFLRPETFSDNEVSLHLASISLLAAYSGKLVSDCHK